MRQRFKLALIGIGAALAAPVSAGGPQQPSTSAETEKPSGKQLAAKDKADLKTHTVCRYERGTGSIMAKKVCRTVADSDANQREAEDYRNAENKERSGRDMTQLMHGG